MAAVAVLMPFWAYAHGTWSLAADTLQNDTVVADTAPADTVVAGKQSRGTSSKKNGPKESEYEKVLKRWHRAHGAFHRASC